MFLEVEKLSKGLRNTKVHCKGGCIQGGNISATMAKSVSQ